MGLTRNVKNRVFNKFHFQSHYVINLMYFIFFLFFIFFPVWFKFLLSLFYSYKLFQSYHDLLFLGSQWAKLGETCRWT